jgi:hypothetical protein
MACDAATLISLAVANGYNGLSNRDLKECILAAACKGATSGAVLHGTGAPVTDPGVEAALYIDDSDGTLYEFYSGAWH